MLGKEKRISRSFEYKNIYQRGKKIPGRHIIAFVIPNSLAHNRVGFVTSKKVGKAVTRNKSKRQLRALVQKDWNTLKPGYDMVIVVRRNFPGASFEAIKRDFSIVMRKAGLCSESWQ
jgi:ribonuclease P protein component